MQNIQNKVSDIVMPSSHKGSAAASVQALLKYSPSNFILVALFPSLPLSMSQISLKEMLL